MRTTVLIAEKNSLFSETLQIILRALGFIVVGTTSDRSNIDAMALKANPDLLVYDMSLSADGRRFTGLKQLKKQLPQTKILVLGFDEAADYLEREILNLGFDGYFSKSGNRDQFIQKINLLFPIKAVNIEINSKEV